MAILITVYACDECRSTIGLKTDEDWQKFEATWWEGLKMQFCPTCAVKPETKARRLADTRIADESFASSLFKSIGNICR